MLKKGILAIGIVATAFGIFGSAQAAPRSTKKLPRYLTGPRPETGSFLNHVALTLNEVIGQVEGDAEVADRLMRHFHMSKPRLLSYLRTLHQTKLEKPGVYLVYNVHADGVLRARPFNLPAGTLIYANAAGKPILRHKCANPMALGPNRGVAGETIALVEQSSPLVDMVEMPTTDEIIAEVAPQEPTVPLPIADTNPPIVTPPPTEVVPVDKTPIISTGGNPLEILTLGLSVGGSLIIGTQGGGNSTPVPEPAGLIAIAIPVGILLTKRAQRRSR